MSLVKKLNAYLVDKYNRLMSDSLYRNSFYLMASTVVMAILGFLFWIVVSRIYTPQEVGIATTIISVSSLIVSFSMLGLNSGLIRFLSSSDRKNDKINSSFNLVAIISVVITAIFILGLKGFSPKLLFIHDNIIYSFIFILFMVFASMNSLLDSVFIAYRNTKYVLTKNTIFSLAKIIIPPFIVFLGAYGIFSAWMIALGISVFFGLFILTKNFNYRPRIVFYDSIFHKIGKYSFASYIAGFVSGLPLMILPLLVTNFADVEYTAYYFICMNIVNLLFIVPQATSNSVFAEGSYNSKTLKTQVKKSIKVIFILLAIGIMGILVFGEFILSIFGEGYKASANLLYLLAFSSIFVGINSIYGSILRVRKRMKKLILISVMYSAFMLTLSYYFLSGEFTIVQIGYAYLISQAFLSIIYFIFYKK